MITTQILRVTGAVIIFNKILIIERNWSIFKFNSLAFFVMLGKFVCSCKVAIVFLALSKKRISSIQHTIKQNIKHTTQQFFSLIFIGCVIEKVPQLAMKLEYQISNDVKGSIFAWNSDWFGMIHWVLLFCTHNCCNWTGYGKTASHREKNINFFF